MNPEAPISRLGNPPTLECPPAPSESGCGILPQTVQGASRSVDIDPHRPAHSFRPAAFDDLGFVYPPEIPAEPEPDFDFDDNEDTRNHDLLMEELGADNDDFARSVEDGWYYSDEN